MSESFVDLSYRGLALGKRIKLTQVRSATGYLEMPTPMPVGTTIAIATDEGVALDALVTEIHEQVAGADKPPGMLIEPALDGAAADWWNARVSPDAVPSAPVEDTRTMVMNAVVIPDDADARDTNPTMPVAEAAEGDDAKRTTMMDAVDLAALGLTSASQEMPAVNPDELPPADDEPGKSKKKKKKR